MTHRLCVYLLLAGLLSACSAGPDRLGARDPLQLLAGEVMGVAYSGYRENQHPDRGDGEVNPTAERIDEDLDILLSHDFRLIRLYDAGENSADVLRRIRERGLPIKVVLGAWLRAELSNHEGCPWLEEPIPESELAANRLKNLAEVKRAIELAREYAGTVVAINVGNEALVDWSDHMVPLDDVIEYVRGVRSAVDTPVTVADHYEWWLRDGARLAAEVDFVGVHSYPQWEGKSIDEALAYTIENIESVRAALPSKPVVALGAGWATTAIEFGERASEANQRRYFNELGDWAKAAGTTVLFFEAFDEPWKGDASEPLGAEKHWGLFKVDRSPKQVMRASEIELRDASAVALAVNVGGQAYVSKHGVRYLADDGLFSGGAAGVIDEIKGAQDDTVYRSYRSGRLRLSQPMSNGRYDMTFEFAEPDDIGPGERVFDVVVQGQPRLSGLDVRRARDGNHKAALERTVTGVEVDSGRLDVALDPRVGGAILNGLVVRASVPDPRRWRLVWGDEFDYEGAPDPGKWTAEEWEAGRVNREDQAYTGRARNVRVEGGHLVLEAHREALRSARYTSGRVHSRGKGDFLYGRVDIRARLPGGRGTWPALWMLPSDPFRYATNCTANARWQGDDDCDAWPNSGEIDIMEHVGYDPTRVHATVHNRAYHWVNGEQRKGSVEVPDADRAFHIYSLEWLPRSIRAYIDGSHYFTYLNEDAGWQAWPFDQPFHLVLNLAIGGSWGGAGGPIDNSIFPARLEVDYVRVYQPMALTRNGDSGEL